MNVNRFSGATVALVALLTVSPRAADGAAAVRAAEDAAETREVLAALHDEFEAWLEATTFKGDYELRGGRGADGRRGFADGGGGDLQEHGTFVKVGPGLRRSGTPSVDRLAKEIDEVRVPGFLPYDAASAGGVSVLYTPHPPGLNVPTRERAVVLPTDQAAIERGVAGSNAPTLSPIHFALSTDGTGQDPNPLPRAVLDRGAEIAREGDQLVVRLTDVEDFWLDSRTVRYDLSPAGFAVLSVEEVVLNGEGVLVVEAEDFVEVPGGRVARTVRRSFSGGRDRWRNRSLQIWSSTDLGAETPDVDDLAVVVPAGVPLLNSSLPLRSDRDRRLNPAKMSGAIFSEAIRTAIEPRSLRVQRALDAGPSAAAGRLVTVAWAVVASAVVAAAAVWWRRRA